MTDSDDGGFYFPCRAPGSWDHIVGSHSPSDVVTHGELDVFVKSFLLIVEEIREEQVAFRREVQEALVATRCEAHEALVATHCEAHEALVASRHEAQEAHETLVAQVELICLTFGRLFMNILAGEILFWVNVSRYRPLVTNTRIYSAYLQSPIAEGLAQQFGMDFQISFMGMIERVLGSWHGASQYATVQELENDVAYGVDLISRFPGQYGEEQVFVVQNFSQLRSAFSAF